MIELERLVIKPGDVVKRVGIGFQPFVVKETKIVNLVQMIYPMMGPPLPASEVEIYSKTEEPLSVRNLNALTRILNDKYGDNWEIISDSLRILYPEIVITNSESASHTIRDLMIRLELDEFFRIGSGDLKGRRFTATQDEIGSGYSHSHLSPGPFHGFSRFCTGSGIIDEVLITARSLNPSEEEFFYEMLFETLDTFVAWESIEGGPYRRINMIHFSQSRFGSPYYSVEEVPLIRLLKKLDVKIPFEYKNTTKASEIKEILKIDQDKLMDEIRDKIIQNINADFTSSEKQVLAKILVVRVGGQQRCIGNPNTTPYNSLFTSYKSIITQDESKLEEDTPNELITIEEKTSDFKFKGEYLKYKTLGLKNNTEIKLKLKDIEIYKSPVSSLINHFLQKFYGELFEQREDFIKKYANNKA